ncbi:MAG: pseudouridine synthase [Hyphomicrobiales bacterium]|jgi:23S rRNA pseudouridine2605 synthase|nr:pseudouridine synthase [Hyphomicrobiales bacterium]
MLKKPNNKIENNRIAKIISRSGAYSRRDAEKLILSGKVKLNGKIVITPATLANSKDIILIDEKKIPSELKTKIWILNKPKGYITTSKDPQNRKTVFNLLPKKINHLISIGRLDINTEGLLLFTNNGELSRFMEHPSNRLIRRYKIKARGKLDQKLIDKMHGEIIIENTKYNVISVNLVSYSDVNTWLLIEISEGKNREIRKICDYFNLQISRLIRTKFGPFELGNIEKGSFIEIDYKLVNLRLKKIGFNNR